MEESKNGGRSIRKVAQSASDELVQMFIGPEEGVTNNLKNSRGFSGRFEGLGLVSFEVLTRM